MATSRNLEPGTHVARIDGLDQRFHVFGRGPLCLVHPGGPGLSWEYLRMPLVERSFTLVYVEPIGTGQSGRLSDRAVYTLERFAHFAHGIVRHLRLERLHLLGHSHGGFVFQHLALAHPEIVDRLVLYSTSPRTGPEFIPDAGRNLELFVERHARHPEALGARQAFERIFASGDDATFTRLFRELLPAYFADYWRDEERLAPLRASLEARWDPMCGKSGPFDVGADLASFDRPTLVLCGRHDFICGPRWSGLFTTAIPHSQRVLFEQSGHMAHLEERERFASVIGSFLTPMDNVTMSG